VWARRYMVLDLLSTGGDERPVVGQWRVARAAYRPRRKIVPVASVGFRKTGGFILGGRPK